MMTSRRTARRGLPRVAALLLTAGTVFQFGSCQFDQITTTTTFDSRELIVSLVRSAILGPIDAAITNAINSAFDAKAAD